MYSNKQETVHTLYFIIDDEAKVRVRCFCGWKNGYHTQPHKESFWSFAKGFALGYYDKNINIDKPESQKDKMIRIYSDYHGVSVNINDAIYQDAIELAKKYV